MKTTKWIQKALGVALAISLLAGCAQESGVGGSQDGSNNSSGGGGGSVDGSPTPTPDNNPLNNEAGGTAVFQYVDINTLNTYVQTRPVNAPTNMKVNVQLRDIGNGRYAGTLKLAYYDNGNYYVGIFETGTSTIVSNQTYKNYYNGYNDAQFNQWFNYNGQQVFHAFFQDRLGAVILVIDGGINLGDGGGYAEVNGSVYFKNFSVTPYPQTQTKCWFQFAPSPYACGTFFANGIDGGSTPIITTSALYPSNGYVKLGTFQGLDKAKAFGQ